MPNAEQKPGPAIAQQFLGAFLRESSQTLGNLSLSDQHIVLAHSDATMPSSYPELASILDIATSTAKKVYKKRMINLWDSASPEVQHQYPLTEILAAQGEKPHAARKTQDAAYAKSPLVKPNMIRLSLAEFIERDKNDPEFRRMAERMARENIENFRRERGREAEGSKEGKSNTENADRELWEYATGNNLIDQILSQGLMTGSEINILTNFFGRRERDPQINKLLDKFSILVAQLA